MSSNSFVIPLKRSKLFALECWLCSPLCRRSSSVQKQSALRGSISQGLLSARAHRPRGASDLDPRSLLAPTHHWSAVCVCRVFPRLLARLGPSDGRGTRPTSVLLRRGPWRQLAPDWFGARGHALSGIPGNLRLRQDRGNGWTVGEAHWKLPSRVQRWWGSGHAHFTVLRTDLGVAFRCFEEFRKIKTHKWRWFGFSNGLFSCIILTFDRI